MARKPSVILTPTEKKSLVDKAKQDVKQFKTEIAEHTKERSWLEKDHAKALKALVKDHEEALKLIDKDIKAANKALVSAENELLKLNPPATPAPAVPSPIGE